MKSGDLSQALADQIPSLMRYARSIAPDQHQAEDLVSDTLVRALERSASFRGDSSLQTWLHRILHNLAADRFRRTREVPVADIVDKVEADWRDEAYSVDAAVVVARAESTEYLLDALIRLPFTHRSAVILHDAHGLTTKDVADIQGIGVPAAKQRVRRGRMMLVSSLAAGAERRQALRGVPLGCWQARSRVSDYIDGELSQADRRLLEAHLDKCPTCPPLYASLTGATDALREWDRRDPDSVVAPHVAERIQARVAGPTGTA